MCVCLRASLGFTYIRPRLLHLLTLLLLLLLLLLFVHLRHLITLLHLLFHLLQPHVTLSPYYSPPSAAPPFGGLTEKSRNMIVLIIDYRYSIV